MNEQKTNALAEIRHQFDIRITEFGDALPKHIPVERFRRVLMTACQNEPKLLQCDRRSLFLAASKCAADGLLPDGRDAALVPHNDTKNKKMVAQYFPMVGGIRKKARNSGEIATWDVHAVYQGDKFDYELGDEPFIRHKPTLGERGNLIAVYSIAVLKSGEKSRDVMSLSDVMKIRALSKGTNTPWANPVFFPEMAKKTVAKRHAKVLPTSTDLDDLLRQDDALYNLEGASDKTIDAEPTPRRVGLASRLNALANPAQAAQPSRPADDLDGAGGDDSDDDQGGEGSNEADQRTEDRGEDQGGDASPAAKADEAPAQKAQEARPAQAAAKAPASKPAPAQAAQKPAQKAAPAESKLMAEARAQAAKGSKAFDAWWLNLSEPDMREISAEAEDQLRAMAERADEQADAPRAE